MNQYATFVMEDHFKLRQQSLSEEFRFWFFIFHNAYFAFIFSRNKNIIFLKEQREYFKKVKLSIFMKKSDNVKYKTKLEALTFQTVYLLSNL